MTVVHAQVPSMEEMWQVIQRQQQAIEDLQARLARAEDRVEETKEIVEITADNVEVVSMRDVTETGRRTTVGGYGEMHYNSLDDNELADQDNSFNQTDFHRFIIFLGHEFTYDIRFFSELEVEHSVAGGSAPGAVELEQAWLEMDINDQHRLRAGLDILPIGIINPSHESNTFYGVERNRVETEIIPSTWWEAGIGFNGEIVPGWNYDVVLHSGLAVSTLFCINCSAAFIGPPFHIRSSRLKVAEALDQDWALTGRLRYTSIPGLEIGVSGQYQADITGTWDAFEVDATLFEGHVDWNHASGFGLRALYARWDLGNDPGLTTTVNASPFPEFYNIDPSVVDADTLSGWYIEPAYRFKLPIDMLGEAGVFTRYSRWDERDQLRGAFRYEEFEQFSIGFNWWPHHRVVFKFEAQWEDADGVVSRTFDGINLGIGYQF